MPHRYGLLVLLILGTLTIGTESVAGERRLGQDGPPLQYQLHDVTISVAKQHGNPAFGRRTVQLLGDGTCRVTTDKSGISQDDPCLSVTTEDLMEVLNECYRVHFFGLQQSYTIHHSIVLKEDGTILTQALRLADTGSTILCLRIGDYEKCVTMVKDVPKELATLTQKIFDLGRPTHP